MIIKKEYPVIKAITQKPEAKLPESDPNSKYITAAAGFCCSLCEVFLRDKSARAEHIEQEGHKAKLAVAEEKRKAEEAAKPKPAPTAAAAKKAQNANNKKVAAAAAAAQEANKDAAAAPAQAEEAKSETIPNGQPEGEKAEGTEAVQATEETPAVNGKPETSGRCSNALFEK